IKIEPPSLNSGNAFCTVNSVPRAFSPKVASKCCSVISPSLRSSPVPALAHNTSTAPFSRLTASNKRSSSSRLAESACTPVTFRPISLTASSRASWRRPEMKTWAPSSTNNLAPASAIPLDPPVITTTLPSSFPMTTPSIDYLAGEVKHLVKAGEHCEGIHDRLISTGSGEALEPAGNRVNGCARFEVDPHGRLQRVRIAAGVLRRTACNRPQVVGDLVLQPLDPEPAGAAAADPAHCGLAGAADPDGRTAGLDRAQVGMDRRQGGELALPGHRGGRPPLVQERQQVIEHLPAPAPVRAARDVVLVLHPPDSHANVKAAVAEHVERGQQPGQVRRLVVERAERAGVQPHPAGRRRGDRPQQHRIEVTGHLRRVRLFFARIGAVHVNRRYEAIADPQCVVAKVLESAAERTQTSGAADSGPDYGKCETKLHRENAPYHFGDPSTIVRAHGAPVRSLLGP